MRSSLPVRGGGGGHFPYPKEVWSPTGGWWTQPRNWRTNTAFTFLGLGVISYAIFTFSANREERLVPPTGWIPSMIWAKQFKEQRMGIRVEE